jgi:hypothetical protein
MPPSRCASSFTSSSKALPCLFSPPISSQCLVQTFRWQQQRAAPIDA